MVDEMLAVVSDAHCPFQDETAVGCALSLLTAIQPNTLVFNGDWIDMRGISRFDKAPLDALTLQADLDATKELLNRFRTALPDTRMVYLWGNHEHRLIRYLHKVPELSPLTCLCLENLLDLKGIECELWPEGQPFLWHQVLITHGDVVRAKAGATAQAMIEKFGRSGISGHTHRAALVQRRNYSHSWTWIEGGCLCKLQPDYAVAPDWQQALTILEYDSGRVWPHLITITEGEARFDRLTFPTL